MNEKENNQDHAEKADEIKNLEKLIKPVEQQIAIFEKNSQIMKNELQNISQRLNYQYEECIEKYRKITISMAESYCNRVFPILKYVDKNAFYKFGEELIKLLPSKTEIEAQQKVLSSATRYMANFAEIVIRYEKNKSNPESTWNYSRYKENLKNFYWATPFQITNKELMDIINNVNNEEEFDNFMIEFFTSDKKTSLFRSLNNGFCDQHKIVLEQSIFAFENKKYSLANMGIISLLDYSLSYLLKDKSITARKGILEPILEEFNYAPIEEVDESELLELTILSNNINMIFERVSFGNQVIGSKKKVRRHPSQHGFGFSNEYIDTLMLLNTLYNVMKSKDILKDCESCLAKGRGGFSFIK